LTEAQAQVVYLNDDADPKIVVNSATFDGKGIHVKVKASTPFEATVGGSA
jgi:hypothetical protein